MPNLNTLRREIQDQFRDLVLPCQALTYPSACRVLGLWRGARETDIDEVPRRIHWGAVPQFSGQAKMMDAVLVSKNGPKLDAQAGARRPH
jgi:hypothetical protein